MNLNPIMFMICRNNKNLMNNTICNIYKKKIKLKKMRRANHFSKRKV